MSKLDHYNADETQEYYEVFKNYNTLQLEEALREPETQNNETKMHVIHTLLAEKDHLQKTPKSAEQIAREVQTRVDDMSHDFPL